MPPVRLPDPTDRRLIDRLLGTLPLSERPFADIGRELYIGEATVKTHLIRAFAKLGVTDRTAAVTAAYASGLIELPRH